MRFRIPFRSPRTRGKDLLDDLREWCNQETVRPDLSAKFEQLRAEVDLPSLSELADRLRREADGISLATVFDRLDRGRAKRNMRKLLRELQDDSQWPRLNALSEALQTEIELPDLPTLNGQQRQALKGMMLLGMVLHTLPVRPPEPRLTTVNGPANVTETRQGGDPALSSTDEARFVQREAPIDELLADSKTADHAEQDVAAFIATTPTTWPHALAPSFQSIPTDADPANRLFLEARSVRGPPAHTL